MILYATWLPGPSYRSIEGGLAQVDARPASRNRSRGIPYDDPDRREARGEGVALGQSVGARDGRSGVGQIDFRPRRSP